MSDRLPIVYLARHGETVWTIRGQHTGLTDLRLTEYGEHTALRPGETSQGTCLCKGVHQSLAARTPDLRVSRVRFRAEIDSDLVERNYSEWNYSEYEGHHDADIRFVRPDLNLSRDGCREGETPEQVRARADNVVSRVSAIFGNVLLFTSWPFIRVLAVQWLGLEPTANSGYLMLSTSSLSALGYERDLSRPVIRLCS